MNAQAAAPVFGPRRILLWGLAWSVGVTLPEAQVVSYVDSIGWSPFITWVLLQWMLPVWWLMGCVLLWAAQRADRMAGAAGIVVALLVVSVAHGMLNPLLAWSLRPLIGKGLASEIVNVRELIPAHDFDTWVSLALWQTWVGIAYGVLLVLGYALAARREGMQRLLHRAALARARAETLLNVERVRAQQAQIDPALLLGVMSEVQARYGRDAADGERLLAALVGFLQSAMPGLRERRSTLGHELELARAYLQLRTERRCCPGWRVDEPGQADCLALAFPSLLMLPLLALADPARPTVVRVRARRQTLRLVVGGLAGPPGPELEQRMRQCLFAHYGERFQVHVDDPAEVEIVLGLPPRQGEPHVEREPQRAAS